MAGSALARSPSAGKPRSLCFSRSLTAPFALPPPPPSPAGSARRRRRRRRRQVVAARRRRVTRRSVRDSGRRQRALRATHHFPPTLPPWLAPSALASLRFSCRGGGRRARSLRPHLARARVPSAVGASTASGPGLEARLRRGLLAASLAALLAPAALSGPWRTYPSLGFEGRSQAEAEIGPCRACVSSNLGPSASL